MADKKRYLDRSQIVVRSWHEVVGSALAMGIVTTVIVSATLWFFNQLAVYAVFAVFGGALVTALTFRSETLARREETIERNRNRLRNHKPAARVPKLAGSGSTDFSPTANRWSRSNPVSPVSKPRPVMVNSWNEDSFLAGLSELSQPGAGLQFVTEAVPTNSTEAIRNADTNFSGELNEHAGRLKTSTESLALNLKLYRLEGEPLEKIETFQKRIAAMETELKDPGAVFRLLHRSWCAPVLDRLLSPEHRADPEKMSLEIVRFLAVHPERMTLFAKAFAVAWIYKKGEARELRRHLTEDSFDAAVEDFQRFLKSTARAS